MIHEWLQKMLKLTIPFKPELFFLNIIPDHFVKKVTHNCTCNNSSETVICTTLERQQMANKGRIDRGDIGSS